MLTNLFQNLREFAISKQGLETANNLIPSESVVELRESEKDCLVRSFQELLNFDDTVWSFAAKAPKIGTKVQQKGRTITCDPAKTYPCGNVCRSHSKDCKSPIEGQAGNYAGWLELQAEMSGKLTPGKGETKSDKPLDKSDKTLDTGNNEPIKQDGVEMKSPVKGTDELAATKSSDSQKLEPRSAKQQEEDKWNLGIPTDKQARDRLPSTLEYIKKIGYKPTEQELADLNSGDGRLFKKAEDSIQDNSYDIRAKKVADIRKEQKKVETQIDALTAQRDQLKAEAKRIGDANSKRIGRSVAKRINAGLSADGGDGRSLNNPKVRDQMNKLGQEASELDARINDLIAKRNGFLKDARELGSDHIESPSNPRNQKTQETTIKTNKPAASETEEGRETRDDGYLLPIAGDSVFTRTAGLMGVSTWKAKVVKVNPDGKTMMIEKSWEKTKTGKPSRMTVRRDEWKVENDPQIEKENKRILEENAKEKAENERLKSEGVISANTAYENAVKSGEKPTEFKDLKKGDRFAQYIPTAGGSHVRLEYEYDGDGFGKEIRADGSKGNSSSVGTSGKFTKVINTSKPAKTASKDAKGYELREITLATSDGKGTKVQARVKGDIAIHQDDKTKGYTVTHIPSGGGVFKFDKSTMPGTSQKELKEKAERLADSLQDLKLDNSKLDSNQLKIIAERLEVVRMNGTNKPVLTLDGNYKDPVAPIGKEDTGKIKLADVKSSQDKEDYAKQELAAAKKSGDKKRIADWENELKKAKVANVKTSQKAQKSSQTSLFNPLAYDDELNKAGLLKGMFSEDFTWTKEAIEFYKNYKG